SRVWLERQGMDEERIRHVCKIIEDLSFKGAGTESPMETLEGKIVQDADRLDAIGAIGIARVFAFGGSKGREIYNPEIEPTAHKSFDAYKASTSSSINHFYEKLFLLKDRMNTQTAKRLAGERHAFMAAFLDRFYKEWEGNG
ncbi:MAG: HD domain-containing protein, partial [Bdellovibrionales bacterium]